MHGRGSNVSLLQSLFGEGHSRFLHVKYCLLLGLGDLVLSTIEDVRHRLQLRPELLVLISIDDPIAVVVDERLQPLGFGRLAKCMPRRRAADVRRWLAEA